MDCAALRVEHERAESDVGMKLTERTIKHARLRQITAGDDGTSLESHCGQLVIHGSNPIGMTNLNFAARELSRLRSPRRPTARPATGSLSCVALGSRQHTQPAKRSCFCWSDGALCPLKSVAARQTC